MTRSYNLFMRFRFFLVGFAVFCCSFAPVCARADLTKADIQDAVFAALTTAPLNMGGQINTVPWMFPSFSSPTVGEWLLTNFGDSQYSDEPLLNVLRRWELNSRLQSNDLARLVSLLGSVSNQLDKTEIGSYANTVDSWLEDIATGLYDETAGTPLLNKIRNLTYTSGSELRVHDDDAVSYLYNLQELLYLFYSSSLTGGFNTSSNFYELKEAVETQTHDIIDYLDQDPTDTEQDAQDEVDEADQDAEDSLEDTVEDYEYEMPELEEPEEPITATPSDSSGVGDISVNVQHSPLITLTQGNASHTPSSPFLPAMEIDLATTPGAENFISQLSTLICFGWDAVFAFLGFCLYYSTFRRIRNMLIATRAGGVPSGEPFSLHYDPF